MQEPSPVLPCCLSLSCRQWPQQAAVHECQVGGYSCNGIAGSGPPSTFHLMAHFSTELAALGKGGGRSLHTQAEVHIVLEKLDVKAKCHLKKNLLC